MTKSAIAAQQEVEKRRTKRKYITRENRFFYLLVLPGIVFLIMFNYMPMAGLYMVFERYTFEGGLFGSEFVGFKNFEFLFRDIKNALRATRNTVIINGCSIVLGTVMNVTIAICINEIRNKKFRAVTQSLMLFPYFMSWMAIGAIALAFLDGKNGLLNQLLTAINMKRISWYMKADYWWPIMIIIRVGKQVGYGSLIYYAALSNFDQGLYEAAKIDGASRWKQITSITLPLLRPTIVTMFLLSIGGILFGGVDDVMGMTQLNGLLLKTTDTIGTYVYRSAIMNGQFEAASAVTLYQSLFGFALVMTANFIIKKIDPDYALF